MDVNMLLLHGDCIQLMKEIPEGSVDMILADLPYGMTRNKWDCVIPYDSLWEQYHRVIKRGGAVLLFGQMPFSAGLCMSNIREFRYEWIWEKSNKTGFLNANRMPMKAHEQILVFYDRLPTYNAQKVKGKHHIRGFASTSGAWSSNYGIAHKILSDAPETDEYYPIDIIRAKSVLHAAEKQVHPTQKPVPLLEYLIRTYTNEGETVLDNVMGSGSTGVACVNTGRNFIGIELDAGYFEIAQRRIQEAQDRKEQEQAQATLFEGQI